RRLYAAGANFAAPLHFSVFRCFLPTDFSIEPLAYLLLSLLNHHLRDKDVSPEEALRELDTMYKVYMKDPKKGFRISRIVTLNKKQEWILKAINPGLLKPSV
ncbi:MAG: hypothetical protein V1899_07710, partial [Planctomycetota bacterium]